jgi:hypothetical protein
VRLYFNSPVHLHGVGTCLSTGANLTFTKFIKNIIQKWSCIRTLESGVIMFVQLSVPHLSSVHSINSLDHIFLLFYFWGED